MNRWCWDRRIKKNFKAIFFLIAVFFNFNILELPALEEEKIISWEKAEEYYGQIVSVEGEVIKTKNIDAFCFMNFHHDFENTLNIAIPSYAFNNFPFNIEEFYMGRKIRVTGEIVKFGNILEIIVTSPYQIEILEEIITK